MLHQSGHRILIRTGPRAQEQGIMSVLEWRHHNCGRNTGSLAPEARQRAKKKNSFGRSVGLKILFYLQHSMYNARKKLLKSVKEFLKLWISFHLKLLSKNVIEIVPIFGSKMKNISGYDFAKKILCLFVFRDSTKAFNWCLHACLNIKTIITQVYYSH